MSTVQDENTLTASSSLLALRRHHTAFPEHDDPNSDPSNSDHRRQKRRRVEVDLEAAVDPSVDQRPPPPVDDDDASQRSASILTQISTWEIPPDVIPDNVDSPNPTGSPQTSQSQTRVLTDRFATPLGPSVPIELSDSDDPTIEFTQTDWTSPSSSIVVHDKADSSPRAPPSNTADPATSSVSTPERLSAYTCPICFSAPTNATLTPCGHICCGQCLFTAVKSTIRRSIVVAMENAPVARCPVCRAEIPGWDGRGGGVIGLKMQVMYSL